VIVVLCWRCHHPVAVVQGWWLVPCANCGGDVSGPPPDDIRSEPMTPEERADQLINDMQDAFSQPATYHPCLRDDLEDAREDVTAHIARAIREAVAEALALRDAPPDREYNDTRHCDHCDKDTPHECYDSGHERDSSNDWQRCLVCRWRASGMTGQYYPPLEGT
jgi:hypothetical protein